MTLVGGTVVRRIAVWGIWITSGQSFEKVHDFIPPAFSICILNFVFDIVQCAVADNITSENIIFGLADDSTGIAVISAEKSFDVID